MWAQTSESSPFIGRNRVLVHARSYHLLERRYILHCQLAKYLSTKLFGMASHVAAPSSDLSGRSAFFCQTFSSYPPVVVNLLNIQFFLELLDNPPLLLCACNPNTLGPLMAWVLQCHSLFFRVDR